MFGVELGRIKMHRPARMIQYIVMHVANTTITDDILIMKVVVSLELSWL